LFAGYICSYLDTIPLSSLMVCRGYCPHYSYRCSLSALLQQEGVLLAIHMMVMGLHLPQVSWLAHFPIAKGRLWMRLPVVDM
jgi:hypothetical protein